MEITSKAWKAAAKWYRNLVNRYEDELCVSHGETDEARRWARKMYREYLVEERTVQALTERLRERAEQVDQLKAENTKLREILDDFIDKKGVPVVFPGYLVDMAKSVIEYANQVDDELDEAQRENARQREQLQEFIGINNELIKKNKLLLGLLNEETKIDCPAFTPDGEVR